MSLNFLSILTPKTEKILLLHITSSGNNSELEVKGYIVLRLLAWSKYRTLIVQLSLCCFFFFLKNYMT